jgi:putative ABC transport system permease protein
MRLLLRSWIWRIPVEREVDEELAFHLEMRTRDLVEGGMDPQAARHAAAARLGDVARLRRQCLDLGRKRDRVMFLTQWFDELRHDVTFSLRQLKGAPAFALAAIVTLALGIGVNAGIFALVDAMLLRPLPYRDPDRLAIVWGRTDRTPRGRASALDILDWLERGRSFEQIAGFVPGTGGAMVMSGLNGTSETVPRQWVTASFFDVLGVQPIAGRTFHAGDASPQPNLVVMSEGLWRTRFGGDRGVIGRQIRFDGLPFTVVGVVPKEFQFLGTRGIWAMFPQNRTPGQRRQRQLMAVGRLKPDVTLDAASRDLASVADEVAREFPDTNRGRGALVEPARSTVIGEELRLTSLLFLGAVGVVLLMCCVNVANLLLARASARSRELAIRSALGAGRRRIVRQLLTESLVLAMLGGALGVAVGAAVLRVAPAMIPADLLPGEIALVFDARVVLFCAVAALMVGVLFGLAPSWQATGVPVTRALAAGGRSVTGGHARVRRLLVMAQMAMAVVLLCAGGLLLRTLLALDRIDKGYRADSVLTMMVDPLGSSFPTREKLAQFFDSIEQTIRGLPGARHVAWSSSLPMSGSNVGSYSFQIAGDATSPEQRQISQPNVVSPAYFDTLDLPLVAGRGFGNADSASASAVCIVDEAFVRRLGGRSPIGLHVEFRPSAAPPSTPASVREIVGVARQVRRPDGTEDSVTVYFPQAQFPLDDLYVLVRPASGRASALISGVRGAIARFDPDQLVSVRDVATLEDVAWEHAGRHRFRARLVATFAGLALLLAMVGVSGVLAYTIQQRRREFGVRLALGANPRDLVGRVLRTATIIVGGGALAGLVLAAVIGRLMSSVLYEVQPFDPPTLAWVVVALGITAAIASAWPAWRASRVDPAAVLRGE